MKPGLGKGLTIGLALATALYAAIGYGLLVTSHPYYAAVGTFLVCASLLALTWTAVGIGALRRQHRERRALDAMHRHIEQQLHNR